MTGEALELRATNGPQFSAALTKALGAVSDLSRPLGAATPLWVGASQAAAPRRTGTMAGAITGRPQGRNRVRITVDTPYAAAIHWGWPAHGIRRQPWIVATFNRDQSWQDRMSDELQADLDAAAATAT